MAKKLFWLFVLVGVCFGAAGAALAAVCLLNRAYAPWLGLLLGAALFLALLLAAKRLSAWLLSPLVDMAKDLDELEKNAPYPELLPFIETLRRQQVQKDENLRQRQEFSANVSHELKTPLTSISGYAEMIETGIAKDEDVKEFAGKIHAEAGRLIDLIRDIIKLSELDEAAPGAEMQPLDILPIAQDTAGMLAFNAAKAGVDISVSGCYAQVLGRRELLEELIYNLCDNAIRYNRPGGFVRVSVSREAAGVRLAVADNGIGIPPEHQERIFERFYRADKSRSKASGGTGLGLAIVKHIVIQHGAELQLESAEGAGTTISVLFPPVA